MLSAVSRAPLAKLQAFKQRMEWTFPWASSHDTDFNFDFKVGFTKEQQRDGGIDYNYRSRKEVARRLPATAAWPRPRPRPEPIRRRSRASGRA